MTDPADPEPALPGSDRAATAEGGTATGPRARRRRVVRRVWSASRRLVDGAEDLVDALSESVGVTAGDALAERIVPAAEALARGVRARRQRFRQRRAREAHPLPNLYRVHPEARLAPIRELGLISIPVAEIVGTAVEGADQRGPDFRPLRAFRSSNWEARWQRLQAASDQLASLPPIDVLQMPDGYWVTDGHNRVAVALANGQVDIDADVRAVVLPGQGPVRPAGPLAPVLVDSAGLQSTRRATRPRVPVRPPGPEDAVGPTPTSPDPDPT